MIELIDTKSGETAGTVETEPYSYETTDAAGVGLEQVLETLEQLGQMNREPSIEANPFTDDDAPIENQPTSMEGNDPPSAEFLRDTLTRRVTPGYLVRVDVETDE